MALHGRHISRLKFIEKYTRVESENHHGNKYREPERIHFSHEPLEPRPLDGIAPDSCASSYRRPANVEVVFFSVDRHNPISLWKNAVAALNHRQNAMSKSLSGRVAVVAGATRGAGRGIARMLGEAEATVYCTGRSSRERPNESNHPNAGRPETIEETADMVTAHGGRSIALRNRLGLSLWPAV